ncbi:MAG: aminoglycoside phosphotransferase family protein [Firmicutes bacterium]|nr:aminoglycoside phosphotransferase family protein [Bacillota bacterium]
MPFEKRAGEAERRAYDLFARAGIPIPGLLSYEAGMLSLEDLRDTHASDWAQAGRMVDMAADLHAAFWDNYEAFGEVGLPWRLDNAKNLERHCKAMEKGIKPYCGAHGMDTGVFRQALAYFRAKMPGLLHERLHAGKNSTVIHGDLHPGNLLMPKDGGGRAVFVDLEAVRMGLGAEDLAMLLGLHIAPEKESALPLLERYHHRLCGRAEGYAFDTLLADYQAALAEVLFFPIKLYFNGIDDADMMKKAIQAWRAFV